MKTCPECNGYRHIVCPVCGGTTRDPRGDQECTYCGGAGTVECNICGGTGQLDDDDDYRA